MKYGKKYADSLKAYDRSKAYDVDEAMGLAVDTAKAKFDETIELHVRLGVDPRQADQQVRGHMFRRTDMERPGLKVAFHNTELVFDLCQPVIFINDFPGIHGQLGCDDLVITQTFSVFRHFIKIDERSYLCGIEDLPGLFIDAFLFKKLPQAFGLGSGDPEIFGMFLQLFQEIKEFFVFLFRACLKFSAPVNNDLFFNGPFVPMFILYGFLYDPGFIFEIIIYRDISVIAVSPFLFFFRAFQQAF